MPAIQLTQGTIEYRDEGAGPPVVLIHGALVNAQVWDHVVDGLATRARCIVPDLPLGSHRLPMNAGADLSPPGLARLIAELLERLELVGVTLVGSDTGGALCQIVAAHHPERLGRLVLTNCDAFENFPPPALRVAVKTLGRVPAALTLLAAAGRFRFARSGAMKAVPLTVKPVPDDLVRAWISPLRDPRIRRDLGRVLRDMSSEHTLAAAEQLRHFERPALVIWGLRDKFFPFADAERLTVTLPQARLERIANARTFVQLDAPQRVADLIAEMAALPAGAA
jgi:pimeloyl-ACP methyl ester carboxylesterase